MIIVKDSKSSWRAVLHNILIVISCTLINILGKGLADKLELPLWLDMVGTCLAAYYVGTVGGMASAVLTNVLYGLFSPESLIYAVIGAAAALVIRICIKYGVLDEPSRAVVGAFWLGILCTLFSMPLNIMVRECHSGNIWGDALVDMLMWNNTPGWIAALAGEAIVDMVDKQLCILLAFVIIRLINRFFRRKKNPNKQESNIQPKALALFLAAGIGVSLAAPAVRAQAEADIFTDNFAEVIYNNRNGMVSSEANTIGETADGCIWIGSYAGLSRFDGNNFEFIREGGLVSVISMMTDSSGRLWIGTNDAGIARYDHGEFSYFNINSGLPANSVRCFAQSSDGSVYVGTSGKVCCFSPDDKITTPDIDVTFVKAMAMYNDVLAMMDNSGGLHFLKDGQLLPITDSRLSGMFCYCLTETCEGFLAGSESGELYLITENNGALEIKKEYNIGADNISAVYEDSSRRIWVGTESGLGHIVDDGRFHKVNYSGFDSSIDCFHEDYQGNIWVTSSRYGVMKLVESRFINIFSKSGVDNAIVNAIEVYNGDFYCATDKGLVILDGKQMYRNNTELSNLVEGARVRCLLTDSKNRMWVCTYSDNGLVCYDPENGITCFNTATCGTTSDRFRCLAELSDGTIAAGTADGINFIKDGALIGTVTAKDGLQNSQILSLVEGKDGSVWAATDGAGIYVIEEGKITRSFTTEDGLSSNIVLRLIPHDDGILVVTSNSLCHLDFSGRIRRLTNFPYFNNYDIILDGDTALITCSAGMYKAKLSDLCADADVHYRLFSANEGLDSGLTANSWNYLSDDGRLFLCSNVGVIAFNNDADMSYGNLKYSLVSLEYDGISLDISSGGVLKVPKNTRQMTLKATVRNYALSDFKVRFYVEGVDKSPKFYDWNDIDPIHITSGDASQYIVRLQIWDGSGENVISEQTYMIQRDIQMWENLWYKTYLIIVSAEILIFSTMAIVIMVFFAKRKEELVEMQKQLEQKVEEQTEEIRAQQHMTEELFLQTVTALSDAVDAKDRYTSGHSKRVAKYARMIASRMGKSAEEQEEIYRAGLLHDVGKIRVPVEIINKPGKLTAEEYDIIKIHPVTGYHILKGISGSRLIALGTKFHHERYDGTGYPNGLVGESIPEIARILGVADAYDAMASNRSYRKALPQSVVRSEIENGKGKQFDPEIADIMLQMIDEDSNYDMRQTDLLHKRILVADNDGDTLSSVKKILSEEPLYEVLTAASGQEALAALESYPIDLILLDTTLGDMDSLTVLTKIRERRQTPVVFTTEDGDADIEIIEKGRALGCDDFVTKPFQPLLLKEVVHSIIDKLTSAEIAYSADNPEIAKQENP